MLATFEELAVDAQHFLGCVRHKIIQFMGGEIECGGVYGLVDALLVKIEDEIFALCKGGGGEKVNIGVLHAGHGGVGLKGFECGVLLQKEKV